MNVLCAFASQIFYDQLAFDQQVDPESIGKHNSVIFDRQDLLSLDGESDPRQLGRKDGFVNRFKQTGPELFVDMQSAIDAYPSDFL